MKFFAQWRQGLPDTVEPGSIVQMPPWYQEVCTCMDCKLVRKYLREAVKRNDSVERPKHYTGHQSGIECIQITEHMNFCLGNAIKYIWRCGSKGEALEDLRKARWYIDREIARLEKEKTK